MQPEDYWKNDRREESVMVSDLLSAVETIKTVAESEELSFDHFSFNLEVMTQVRTQNR